MWWSFDVNPLKPQDAVVAVAAAGTDVTGDRGKVQNRGHINQKRAKQGNASYKTLQCISRWVATASKSHLSVLHGSGGGKEGQQR